MKYTLEIEEDLLAELSDIAKKLNVETGKLILACVKAQIISFDILDGIITRDKSK